MEALECLVNSDIVIGREKLVNNSSNLNDIATKSEEAFKQARSKEDEIAVVEQTKSCVTHALASVAHQINTLASDLNALIEGESHQMKLLHYDVNQLEMKGRAFDSKRDMKRLSRFISRKFKGECKRKTKRHLRARHSKGKYIHTEIDYGALDKIGHGMVPTPQKTYDINVMSPRSPCSSGAHVKKEQPRWSIAEPVWEPMEVTYSEPRDAGMYDFKRANAPADFTSSLGVGESIYSDLLPEATGPASSSLRLRRESDTSVAQTPTSRSVSDYFMFLKTNEDEYANYDDYQLSQRTEDATSPHPTRPIKHANEPIYEEPPLDLDVESVLNELDDATANNTFSFDRFSIKGQNNVNGSLSIEPVIPPSLPDKRNTGLFPSTAEDKDNSNVMIPSRLPEKPASNTGLFPRSPDTADDSSKVILPPLSERPASNTGLFFSSSDTTADTDYNVIIPPNVSIIPEPPPFNQNIINNGVSLPNVKKETPNFPEQTDRLAPSKSPGFLSSSLINRTKGQLKSTPVKPMTPPPAIPSQKSENAVDSIASILAQRSSDEQSDLNTSGLVPPLSDRKQPPVVSRKPPPTKRKPPPTKTKPPRPQSELVPPPQNRTPNTTKTPPPPPPKPNRFSTLN